MKITSVEIIPVDQKHKGELIFSSGPTHASDEFIVLRIKTDEGYEGIGSACSFPRYPLNTGCTRDAGMYLMKDLADLLIGEDPMRLSYLINKLEKAISAFYTENWYNISHFDAALYDLKGKILGVPAYELLGGLHRSEIPLEFILSYLPTPEAVAEQARTVVKEYGYKSVKVHLTNNLKNAEARVKAVREAIGPDVPMAVDMGMNFRAPDAARFINYLDKEYNLNFVEQPLFSYDVVGQQYLRTKTKVPLTADHSGMSLTQAYDCIRQNLFDNYHCLVTRIGGLYRSAKFCDLMDTAGLGYQICNQGNTIAGAAAAHLACSRNDRVGRYYDELALYLYLHGTYDTKSVTDDIVKVQPAVIENGVLKAPTGAGLGIELDEEMLKRYTCTHINPIIVK